jgi:hypothetical protein
MTNTYDADKDSSHYRVGYGKPPKESQFKKGQSGNPRGRRKDSKNSGTLLANALDEIMSIKEGGQSKTITKRAAIYKQVVNKAVQGDIRAIRLVFEGSGKLEKEYPERFTADAELEQRSQMAVIRAMTLDERRRYLEIVRSARQRVRENDVKSAEVKSLN